MLEFLILFGLARTMSVMIRSFTVVDQRLFVLCGRLVRTWSKWTGKSNFTLTRLLAFLAVMAIVVPTVLTHINVASFDLAIIWLVAIWIGSWAFIRPKKFVPTRFAGQVYEVERLVESADDVLPAELREYEKHDADFRKIALSIFSSYILFLLIWGAGYATILLLLLFSSLLLLPHYTLYNYSSKGTKSRIKEKIAALFTRRAHAPSQS